MDEASVDMLVGLVALDQRTELADNLAHRTRGARERHIDGSWERAAQVRVFLEDEGATVRAGHRPANNLAVAVGRDDADRAERILLEERVKRPEPMLDALI